MNVSRSFLQARLSKTSSWSIMLLNGMMWTNSIFQTRILNQIDWGRQPKRQRSSLKHSAGFRQVYNLRSRGRHLTHNDGHSQIDS